MTIYCRGSIFDLLRSVTSVQLKCFVCFYVSVDSASTVPSLLSIFHEQEMTETVHDTKGHGYLATLVGKHGR